MDSFISEILKIEKERNLNLFDQVKNIHDIDTKTLILLLLSKKTYSGRHAFTFNKDVKNLDNLNKEPLTKIYLEAFDNKYLDNDEKNYVRTVFDAEYYYIRSLLVENKEINTIVYEGINNILAFAWNLGTYDLDFTTIYTFKDKIIEGDDKDHVVNVFEYEDMLRIFNMNDPIDPATKLSYPFALTDKIRTDYRIELMMYKRSL